MTSVGVDVCCGAEYDEEGKDSDSASAYQVLGCRV